MADLPTVGDFPVPPDPLQSAVPNAPQPQASTAGVGAAGHGAVAADDFLAALRGLQQGFMTAQMNRFNQVKTAWGMAKARYDGAVSRLNALTAAGIPRTDDRAQHALAEIQQASQELDGRQKQMEELFSGGKGAKSKSAEPGQETPQSKLSRALTQISRKVSPIAKAAMGMPKPLGPVPQRDPGITGAVPPPPQGANFVGSGS